jgi:hypothetical protein
METPYAHGLLDAHRELCAAIRRADQACGRLYAAPDASSEAARCESEYLAALECAREALDGLRALLARLPHPEGRIALQAPDLTAHA